ncbi:NACHT domain-containing protein [Phocaeicola plebeius]|uniref:NACHT domain-containing protein n=1 Tax=Phocaeicola plebeius TaxID=310297 RepID=UPI0026F31925|nr:hypothetical protein [Phocaeicola plebeius]
MSIFDLLGLDIEKLQQVLTRWNINVNAVYLQAVIDIFLFCLLVYLFCKGIKKLGMYLWNLTPFSARKMQNEYIHSALDHDFKEYLGEESQRQYIETQFLSTPPHEFDEPNKATTATTREPMDKFCNRIFKDNNPNERVYMVLAGSGMGKTTFMVNVFCHYVKQNMTRKGMNLDIRLLRLDDEKVLDDIKKISEDGSIKPEKTILLLDALDENRYASGNFVEFKQKLEDAMEPFGLVMITCRDQFFDNEKSIPTSTSWVSVTKDKNLINYNKIYISPFSDEDIKKYLALKYKKRKKRKQASQIAEKCKVLMARPLLLSYMDDLLDGNFEFKTIYEIYRVLIDKWLQREVNKIQSEEARFEQKKMLYHFSVRIARTIYENWKDTKSMLLSPEQMEDFMTRFNYSKVPYELKRRSLINRNVSGYYKFAHKSFLEFFLAQEYFHNSTFKLDFEGMDMARRFYEEMCISELRDWQENNCLDLVHEQHNMCSDEFELEINLDIEIDYEHLADALDAMSIRLKSVRFPWNLYSDKLHLFLARAQVPNVQIQNYNVVNNKTPRKLLELQGLVSLSFKSTSEANLPKKFISLAQRKNILTLLNEEFVTWCESDIHKLPYDMLLNYSMNRRHFLLKDNRLDDLIRIVNHSYREDEDND